jgi:hypothetical protein
LIVALCVAIGFAFLTPLSPARAQTQAQAPDQTSSTSTAASTDVHTPTRSSCEPSNLGDCMDTNWLIWSNEFIDDLTAFIGDGTASWLYKDGDMINQVIDVLGGPPEEPVKVGDGLLRFAACRAHSCPEKGAVFLTKSGEIKMVAVLDYRCADDCNDDYTLEILIRKRDPALEKLATQWAEFAIKRGNDSFQDLPKQTLANTEVRIVPGT